MTRQKGPTVPHGRWVDATLAREHAQALCDAGMSWMQIEAATRGVVHRTQVRQLLLGVNGRPPCRRVLETTAAALLAVGPRAARSLEHGAGVDPTGTRRRLQALVALGYEQTWIAAQLSRSYNELYRTLNTATFVRAKTAHETRALYDRLSMIPGPSVRAVNVAKRNGWAPPLAWDDDDIDDPGARPEGVGFRRSHLRGVVEHGTEAGYRAHLRAGEKACDDCRRAATRAKVDRHARRRSA